MTTQKTQARTSVELLRAALVGLAWLTIVLLGAWLHAARAHAQPTPESVAPDIVTTRDLALPPLPRTHLAERRGKVLWSFPARARDEAHALQRSYDDAWPRIVDDLGGDVAPELEIRLATNPEEMRELAPIGAPPPAYATGVTYPGLGVVLISFTSPETWERPAMDKVLAHELSHVALHRAAGDARLPRWFVEGLAVNQSGEHSLARMQTLAEAVVGGSLIPLSRLSASFPSRSHQVSLAYAQSASIVGHLRGDDARQRKFERLMSELRKGQTFSAALFETYYVTPADLEREWRADVSNRFTATPLIATGSGVWALATVLALAAWVRRRRKHRQTLARWAIEEETARRQALELATQRALEMRRALEAQRWADAVAAAEAQAVYDGEREVDVPTVRHAGRDHTVH